MREFLAALAALDQRLDPVPIVARARCAERPRDDFLVRVFAHEAGLELARREPDQLAGLDVDRSRSRPTSKVAIPEST